VLTEDLIFKEKQVNSLHDKVATMKAEKSTLQDEVETKTIQVCRLAEQVERQDHILQQQCDTRSKHSMDLANHKICDLQSEVDELQKKNLYLQRRMDDMLLTRRLAGDGVALSQESIEDEERRESTVRTLNRENELLKSKLALSDKNLDAVSDKMLRWKEQVDISERIITELHAELTKKEIQTTALLNEKKSLSEANEELRDAVVKKNFELKKLESDFKRAIDESLKHDNLRSPSQARPADDGNLELVKVTKEVNRMLTKELECLYCLLHDTFVSELTGRTLDEMIKSKLVDRNRERLLQPY
jgi:chromosome segregation ATPase